MSMARLELVYKTQSNQIKSNQIKSGLFQATRPIKTSTNSEYKKKTDRQTDIRTYNIQKRKEDGLSHPDSDVNSPGPREADMVQCINWLNLQTI